MKYRYFVSFTYNAYLGGHRAYENCCLDLESKISGAEDIDTIQMLIKGVDQKFQNVRILNFILID